MAKLHDMRLKLLVQQEHERIAKSQPNDLDLSIVQARCLCWLALLTEAHEDQANDAEKRGDAEQAMGWFADSMRLTDVINIVTSIEIPYLEESSTFNDDDLLINNDQLNENHIDLYSQGSINTANQSQLNLQKSGLSKVNDDSDEIVNKSLKGDSKCNQILNPKFINRYEKLKCLERLIAKYRDEVVNKSLKGDFECNQILNSKFINRYEKLKCLERLIEKCSLRFRKKV